MRSTSLRFAPLLLLLAAASLSAQVTTEVAFPNLTFTRPVDMQYAPGQPTRLYVVEQQGIIRSFTNDPTTSTTETFLDIRDRVRTIGNEEGLLGLAFHPDFQTNGFFYVYYSASNPQRSILSRFSVNSSNPNQADSTTEVRMMEIGQPYANHNGGQIRFGPDGFLYIALGDGGNAGDPKNNAQDPNDLLGALLRIDVNTQMYGHPYGIPADNPFAGDTTDSRGKEIYAYGFRNPFRFSFDRQSGWLWLGDVGQNAIEEVNVVRKGGNYGWRIMEGGGCFDPFDCKAMADQLGLLPPIWDYTHREGRTVIGGFVYRGTRLPSLAGHYIYADFISGRIWALDYDETDTTAVKNTQLVDTELLITSFGEDQAGELYMLAFDGKIHRLNGAPPPASPVEVTHRVAFPNLTFERPVDMQYAPGTPNRLYIVEQKGVIRGFENVENAPSADVFLDIQSRVRRVHNEEGLLGLAFHPNYATNGFFYVYYSASNPRRSILSRFSVDPSNPNRADTGSEVRMLEIPQPFGNHNGGQIRFGADGYLYIALGDGGNAADPHGNAQKPEELLGSLLRIDVNSTEPGLAYGIPDDNPFAGDTSGKRGEIYAYGFRNPFRFSFDRQTNWLWMGDVGQSAIEEINVVNKGGNYGWAFLEGSGCFFPKNCRTIEDTMNLVPPIFDYTHRTGETVIGGFVYRGSRIPALVGHYVYADFIAGDVWGLKYNAADTTAGENIGLIDSDLLITSFGEDAAGELYLLAFDGKIYTLESGTTRRDDDQGGVTGQPMISSYPNPSRSGSTIEFTVTHPGKVRVSVVDMFGKTLRTLVNEHRSDGRHAIAWNGTGEDGRILPSGSYLVRVDVDGALSAMTKVVLEK